MNGAATPNSASMLTPPGLAAVAVVLAQGSAALAAVDAHFRAANGRPLAAQPLNRIAFGHWRDGGHAEDVVVCCTGIEQVEVHCHGGAAPAERILGALAAAGCRISPWQDWPPTAGGLAIDAAAALAYAPTRRTAAILLDQSAGAFDREVAAIRRLLANRQMELARRGLNKLLHLVPLGSRLTQP